VAAARLRRQHQPAQGRRGARRLVAVSPGYANEIRGELGFGLGGIFAARGADLRGILNGIEPSWDPATDPHLPARYDATDLAGKAVCKATLQREMGLPVRARVPLLGMVARLDHQKGADLVLEALPWLMRQDVQLVVLGSGSPALAEALRHAARQHPGRMAVNIGFSEPLAHRIEAGADVFLMPSRFEPCGLNQMYSMRYGTVPVVHATGGLADTVDTVDPARDVGTGWAFRSFQVDAFIEALGWALLTWSEYPEAWAAIQKRGMTRDFSWDRSAAGYERVYAEALAEE
jgi:starch synthase